MIMETVNNILVLALILLIIFLVSMVPWWMGHRTGYQDGQIDALNGKIHYRLEKQDDSQFLWVECPNVCEYEKGE